jgi:hypothetical protein
MSMPLVLTILGEGKETIIVLRNQAAIFKSFNIPARSGPALGA